MKPDGVTRRSATQSAAPSLPASSSPLPDQMSPLIFSVHPSSASPLTPTQFRLSLSSSLLLGTHGASPPSGLAPLGPFILGGDSWLLSLVCLWTRIWSPAKSENMGFGGEGRAAEFVASMGVFFRCPRLPEPEERGGGRSDQGGESAQGYGRAKSGESRDIGNSVNQV